MIIIAQKVISIHIQAKKELKSLMAFKFMRGKFDEIKFNK